jgi:hypothetical protein
MHRPTEKLRGGRVSSMLQTAPDMCGKPSAKQWLSESINNYRLHSFTNDPI